MFSVHFRSFLSRIIPGFFVPILGTELIILLCVIITSLHSRDLVDFGLSLDTPYNFFIWHFTHRSYFHSLSNILLLVLLVGSNVKVSLFELSMLSLFVLCLGVLDPTPFYGASALIFLCIGKLTRLRYVLSSYPFLYSKLPMPYLASTLLIVYQITLGEGSTLAIEFLHGFSFLFGVSEISFEHYAQKKQSLLVANDA